jgi:hypothetical protein
MAKLMREDAGTWRVYERGNTFKYQVNGKCTVAGKTEDKCMWFGFELDFEAATESTLLSCVAYIDSPTNIVTYEAEKAKDAQLFRFELTLAGRSGHMSNPSYFVIAPGESAEKHLRVECSHSGKIVLRYAFTFHEI